MLPKLILVVSHLGSASDHLCDVLTENPRVQRVPHLSYDHPFVLDTVTGSHKCGHAGALWLDELLYNTDLSHKVFYELCRFVYVISPLEETPYYRFRLRRMAEMAKCTPEGVLLTWEDLAAARFGLVEEYLNLREPLKPGQVPSPRVKYSAAYEFYFSILRRHLRHG